MDALVSALESPAGYLFRRCVQCPQTAPSCPQCPDNQVCSLTSQSCDQCASTTCVASTEVSNQGSQQTGSPSSGSAANSGAIAGAVIGGLIVIAIVTYLVWRFCIKNRRRDTDAASQDFNMGSEKDVDQMGRLRDPRASTHTVASFASSAFTRASNIIQIAYIPGVTNRSVHSSQDLVPPVPPIPAASAGNSPRVDGDERYFRPDIRDSTFSDVSDRKSMARNSIASTVYRSDAIVSPVPAQMASRAKPTAVSVRSNKNSPSISRSTTPPIPTVPDGGFKTLDTKSSIVGRVGQPKPVQILRKGSQTKPVYELDGTASERSLISPFTSRSSRQNSTSSPLYDDSEDEGAGRRLINSTGPAELSAYSQDDQADPWEGGKQTKKSTSLNQIIEEAAMQASRGHVHGYASQADANPFTDTHEAHTP